MMKIVSKISKSIGIIILYSGLGIVYILLTCSDCVIAICTTMYSDVIDVWKDEEN